MNRFARQGVLVLCTAFLVSGCATSRTTDDLHEGDPAEQFNRSVLEFNLASDRLLLKPVAAWYDRYVPSPVSTGLSNFFSNLLEPITALNDMLQGKPGKAGRDTGRFLINSTLGLFGLLDVATEMGLERRREDFGQTLAVWGVPDGPYLVLPFLGPSTLRDAFGLVPQYYGDPVLYLDPPGNQILAGTRIVDSRSHLLGADEVLDLQPDKYLFLREAYWKQRTILIQDGQTGPEDAESQDELLDELLEE